MKTATWKKKVQKINHQVEEMLADNGKAVTISTRNESRRK